MADTGWESKTAEDLRGASDRLFYEWQMLTGIAEAFEEGVDDQLTRKLLIEAGAIHSRNLVDFFYGEEQRERKKRRVRQDDMVAEHFFQEKGDWREARGELPSALEYDELVFYVDKQIVHLVYPQRERKGWDFTGIGNALQPALETFLGMIDEEQVGDRWKGLLERPEDSLDPGWGRLRNLIEAKGQSQKSGRSRNVQID